MKFEKKMIYLGLEKKKSKKTGNEYELIKLIDEDGDYIVCIVENIKYGLEQLSYCNVKFDLQVGRYMTLKAVEVI